MIFWIKGSQKVLFSTLITLVQKLLSCHVFAYICGSKSEEQPGKKSNFAIFETLYDLRKKLNHRQPALPSPWISLKVQLWRNLRTLYDGCQLNFWNSRSDFSFFLIQRLTSIYNYRTSSYSFRPWIVSAHLCTEIKGHST